MRPKSRCSGVPRTSITTIFGGILKIKFFSFFGEFWAPLERAVSANSGPLKSGLQEQEQDHYIVVLVLVLVVVQLSTTILQHYALCPALHCINMHSDTVHIFMQSGLHLTPLIFLDCTTRYTELSPQPLLCYCFVHFLSSAILFPVTAMNSLSCDKLQSIFFAQQDILHQFFCKIPHGKQCPSI